MPEIRYYTVTQVREIQVAANNELQAAILATKEFDDEEYSAEPGVRVTKGTQIVELDVKRTN
jgi:hypothetical protein